MNRKKSFIMYTDYQKHINRLSDEEAGKLIKAVLMYTNSGEEPVLSPAADMAFSFIKEQIDRDCDKWEDTCRKRSEAGKLGGRPRKQTQDTDANAVTSAIDKEAKKANGFSEKQTIAKKAENVDVSVSENENKNDNAIVIGSGSEYVSESENKNDYVLDSDIDFAAKSALTLRRLNSYVDRLDNSVLSDAEEIYTPDNCTTDTNNNNNINNIYSNTDTDKTTTTNNNNINSIFSDNDYSDNTCSSGDINNIYDYYNMIEMEKKSRPKKYEVIEFARENGAPDLAEKFYNYYNIREWKTKGGDKITNWKEAFLRWKEREKPFMG